MVATQRRLKPKGLAQYQNDLKHGKV